MARSNRVKTETIDATTAQFVTRELSPVRFRRWKSGLWAMDIEILVWAKLPDGRLVCFSGIKSIPGTQHGRKPETKRRKAKVAS